MGIEDFRCEICGEFFSTIDMSRFNNVCDFCEAKRDDGEDYEED